MRVTMIKIPAPVLALSAFLLSTGDAFPIEAQYECAGGIRVHAAFSSPGGSPGSVVLVFSDTSGEVRLPQVRSADGGRYANDDVEFWIKGNEATLTRAGRSDKCHTK